MSQTGCSEIGRYVALSSYLLPYLWIGWTFVSFQAEGNTSTRRYFAKIKLRGLAMAFEDKMRDEVTF